MSSSTIEIVDAASLDLALRQYHVDSHGQTTHTNAFLSLFGGLLIRDNGKRDSPLTKAVMRAVVEMDLLLTIVERVQWQREQNKTGHLSDTAWLFYSAADVEHWYVALRTTFDNIALVVRESGKHPGQCPDTFSSLQSFVRADRAPQLFSAELINVVNDCGWFDEIKNTRDNVVHRGGITIAIPTQDTIRYSITTGPTKAKPPSALKVTTTLHDFEGFIAWSLGSMNLLLHTIGAEVIQLTNIPKGMLGGWSTRRAHGIMINHLNMLRARLAQGNVESKTRRGNNRAGYEHD